jgi:hypothetical protein
MRGIITKAAGREITGVQGAKKAAKTKNRVLRRKLKGMALGHAVSKPHGFEVFL